MGCEKDRGGCQCLPCLVAMMGTQVLLMAILIQGARMIVAEFKALQTTVLKITTDAAQAQYAEALR